MFRYALTIVSTFAAAGSAFAGDLTINFGNNLWDPIKAVEISPAGAGTWSAIPLANDTLGAGEFVEVPIAGGDTVCTFDLRFTKADDTVQERPGVNLCEETYYHFGDI